MIARPNWTARFAGALLLLLAGAALATWALARSAPAARLFGVAPSVTVPLRLAEPQPVVDPTPLPQEAARLAAVEGRLATVESATLRAQGSAGRADALLVAFAARRAVDRGLALGYLEPLLVERFGAGHEQAVATIVTSARQPVLLDALIDQYDALGDALRSAGPDESWWTGVRRELGSLDSIRRADVPSVRPQARFDRAEVRLRRGEVDGALAETMRLPGVARAGEWVAQARRFIAVHRALDEIESAALLPAVALAPAPAPPPAAPAAPVPVAQAPAL
ncbi:hypothetical protein [Sphingomonas sp.]|uniref:hypothetical protein n=1 Tax=Sphingomonas sp. TaxID=28214 RepID=UPI00325FCB48